MPIYLRVSGISVEESWLVAAGKLFVTQSEEEARLTAAVISDYSKLSPNSSHSLKTKMKNKMDYSCAFFFIFFSFLKLLWKVEEEKKFC